MERQPADDGRRSPTQPSHPPLVAAAMMIGATLLLLLLSVVATLR